MSKHKGARGIAIAGLGFGVAAGVALGALVIAPNTPNQPGSSERISQDDLNQARKEAEINEAQASSADSVLATVAEDSVSGMLDNKSVLVIATADADEDDVESVRSLLSSAGAKDAGVLNLGKAFLDQDGADRLKSIVANTLPAGAQLSEQDLDPGTHAGEALGSALLVDPDTGEAFSNDSDRDALLGALAASDYVSYEEGSLSPADAVVMITGDSDGSGASGFGARTLANCAKALDSRGGAVVLAGQVEAASETGPLGLARADAKAKEAVSTVDSIDREWGRLAAVLAVREQIDGHVGSYGAARGVDAASPEIPKSD